MIYEGNIVDIHNERIFKGKIVVKNGKIKEIIECQTESKHFILPGFIDSHVHIESSMLTPYEFSRIALQHGTIAAVCDPHEIANVLGKEGIDFMLESAEKSPMYFAFGVPSCVPATFFETNSAILDSKAVCRLLKTGKFTHLSEVMNFPGVIYEDEDVLKKIECAKKLKLSIDGHCPGLTGKDLQKYAKSGITTEHEATTLTEAEEKIACGMKILIREGSAAKNFNQLIPLIEKYHDRIMFCTDDIHPDNLEKGHINTMVKKAIKKAYNLFKVLKAASLNPIIHYNLETGILRKGDFADFIVVDSIENLSVIQTVIKGKTVFEKGKDILPFLKHSTPNNFSCELKTEKHFKIESKGKNAKVIVAKDKSLLTDYLVEKIKTKNGEVITDIEKDILKIAVINRYKNTKPALGLIKGLGIKKGAIASSVAHDSHNIVATGCDDYSLKEAVNKVIENRGGLYCISNEKDEILPLPIGGIMSDKPYHEVAHKYSKIDRMAKELGSKLSAPFMTLSFMPLPVIPKLKITDKGLFDAEIFRFTDLFC